MKFNLTLIALIATSAPVFAAGDPVAGEAVFKQCQTCHIVADADGKVLAGKAAKTGPNLYGVVGRTAGTYPDFKYGEDMIAAGAGGLVWDEATLVAYVQNPSAFLKETLNDKGAKGSPYSARKPVGTWLLSSWAKWWSSHWRGVWAWVGVGRASAAASRAAVQNEKSVFINKEKGREN